MFKKIKELYLKAANRDPKPFNPWTLFLLRIAIIAFGIWGFCYTVEQVWLLSFPLFGILYIIFAFPITIGIIWFLIGTLNLIAQYQEEYCENHKNQKIEG